MHRSTFFQLRYLEFADINIKTIPELFFFLMMRLKLTFSSVSADVDGGSRAVRKLSVSLSDSVLLYEELECFFIVLTVIVVFMQKLI